MNGQDPLPPPSPSIPSSSLSLSSSSFLLPLLIYFDCCYFSVPPPLLSPPVSSSPPWRCAMVAQRWWQLPRPCPPPLRCQCAACRRCCRAASELPLTPLPHCHCASRRGAAADDAALLPRCRLVAKLAAASVRHARPMIPVILGWPNK